MPTQKEGKQQRPFAFGLCLERSGCIKQPDLPTLTRIKQCFPKTENKTGPFQSKGTERPLSVLELNEFKDWQ